MIDSGNKRCLYQDACIDLIYHKQSAIGESEIGQEKGGRERIMCTVTCILKLLLFTSNFLRYCNKTASKFCSHVSHTIFRSFPKYLNFRCFRL